MTVKQRILELLASDVATLCDGCIAKRLNLSQRQMAFQANTSLAAEGRIDRTRGACSGCGRTKTVNSAGGEQAPETLRPAPGDVVFSSSANWYWEGNVQAKVATWLATNGYVIRSVADTSTRASGKDIVAEAPNGRLLWVSAKGYPVKSRHTQARHWLAGAVFDLILYRNEDAQVDLAIALPGGFTTYENLLKRIASFREVFPFRVFIVDESGAVTAQ